ncbi:hypothetical protein B0J13DRAFT_629385 [Dactylonectria estremocensis]|uniref:Uncharacterized protein n=1 Tax=Dactylonectria estremocensis TaxID=1079267 RepID=A0A9P9DIY4_9HYPO|nr:hypothetical protein B0J13DRAFT_629385 [Dactylonectria estremocensis]
MRSIPTPKIGSATYRSRLVISSQQDGPAGPSIFTVKAKGVTLARRKAQANAFDKLGENPTEEEYKTALANAALVEFEERVDGVRDSWETNPLFEDAFEEPTANLTATGDDADVCTPEEASRLRRELREQGPAVFCERTVDAGRYTAKKLLSAFGIRRRAHYPSKVSLCSCIY